MKLASGGEENAEVLTMDLAGWWCKAKDSLFTFVYNFDFCNQFIGDRD